MLGLGPTLGEVGQVDVVVQGGGGGHARSPHSLVRTQARPYARAPNAEADHGRETGRGADGDRAGPAAPTDEHRLHAFLLPSCQGSLVRCCDAASGRGGGWPRPAGGADTSLQPSRPAI